MEQDLVLFTKAIADATRQKIMKMLCCEWLSVNEVVAKLDVSQPTVSHHLAILRDAGLVNVREEGKQTFYTLNQEQVSYCCGQLLMQFAPEEKSTLAMLKTLQRCAPPPPSPK